MKKILTFSTLIIMLVSSCVQKSQRSHYPSNPDSMVSQEFIQLPLGSVKAGGWLERQLEIQAEGLTGYLDAFWPDLINSAWRGGEGEAWERGPYYLDGLVPLAYLLENEELIEKVESWMPAILASSGEEGWFGPTKNSDRWPLAVALKVLRQYQEATGSTEALQVIEDYFAYLANHEPDWPDHEWRGVRAMETAVTGYWLYRRNGDTTLLNTIASIQENCFDWTGYFEEFPWDSVAVAEDLIPHNWEAEGLTAHVVNNAMAIKYPALWYQQSGDQRYLDAVYTALEKMDSEHGQVGGRFSGDEHLSGKSPTQGTELCAVVELMFSLENILEIVADARFSDRLEALAYNAFPATLTPDYWAHQYDQQANQVLVSVDERDWSTNGNASNIYGLMPNYPCCLANMHQGWPKFVRSMWMATADGGLVATVLGPSQVEAKVGEGSMVRISEETDYPFSGEVLFRVNTAAKTTFPLRIYIPSWADEAAVKVGEEVLTVAGGQYYTLERAWSDGDEVRLSLPMKIRSERRYRGAISVLRGPLYFALRIGKEFRDFTLKERDFGSIGYPGSADWEIKPTTAWNYGLKESDLMDGGQLKVHTGEIGDYPFADTGDLIYNADCQLYEKWDQEVAVRIALPAYRIPGWGLEQNSAAPVPLEPDYIPEAEQVVLVPYGATRLRITEFPFLY